MSLRRLGAWFVCWKRPWNQRGALLVAVGDGEYRCRCGRCDLPVFPPRHSTAASQERSA